MNWTIWITLILFEWNAGVHKFAIGKLDDFYRLSIVFTLVLSTTNQRWSSGASECLQGWKSLERCQVDPSWSKLHMTQDEWPWTQSCAHYFCKAWMPYVIPDSVQQVLWLRRALCMPTGSHVFRSCHWFQPAARATFGYLPEQCLVRRELMSETCVQSSVYMNCLWKHNP